MLTIVRIAYSKRVFPPQKQIQDEREKRRLAIKEESAFKAAERRSRARAVSDSEDEEGDDPLKPKEKAQRDPMESMYRKTTTGSMPPSKASSGKGLAVSHKADRMERASPRRISRVEEKEKRMAKERAEQEQEDRVRVLGMRLCTNYLAFAILSVSCVATCILPRPCFFFLSARSILAAWCGSIHAVHVLLRHTAGCSC